MAIHSVRDDRRRVVANIRTHGERFVDVSQVRRWTFADARLVANRLLEIVGAETDSIAIDMPKPAVASGTTTTAATILPVSLGGRPTLRGPGSSRAAWLDYARAKGVPVTGTMSRDDIATAVQDHETALSGV